ncbi:MAG TPA: 16S rRNA (guanine(966)-N(2))-methyltransferase RsmD [Micromonosporaceae bacterium]|nr:16S rRNA (guanine(966)-N(2))-methyltransferase RsmD [Micromonosporaceae bacterium]
MTRIIAGAYGGRRITAPPGDDTRPTADRVREAMFSGLDAANRLYGRAFLDLYAGSGAVGLEAASRGAGRVALVESDPRAVRVIRDNVASLGAGQVVSVVPGRVAAVLAGGPGRTGDTSAGFDTVFADPPYATAEAEIAEVLAALAAGGWLNEGAQVIVERSKRSPEPVWPRGVTAERSRRYGEAMLWYGRRS